MLDNKPSFVKQGSRTLNSIQIGSSVEMVVFKQELLREQSNLSNVHLTSEEADASVLSENFDANIMESHDLELGLQKRQSQNF